MKTRLLDNRDFLAGLLFITIGGAGFGVALSYPFGNVQQMGPGFFPRILGAILVGFGVVTLVRGLRSGEPVQGGWGWFPLAVLTASLVAFGWLMEHVGLVPSLVALIVSSAYAGREFRWGEVAVLAVAMTTFYDVPALKIYKSAEDKEERKRKRTTSQFVFAFGLNNLITKGRSLEDSDYRVWGSHFYEWGVTYNSRLLQNHNLLHVKYGLSLMYNNLRPTDNRYFVKNGDQTNLVTSTRHLDDSRFRNVFLTLPLHLEFDFSPKKTSKDGTKTYFKTHESVRIGIGGYSGIRVKSKQLLHYEENGGAIKNKQKGDFNVSDFTYGLSTYIGFYSTSLYVKYDLNPMFKHNTIDQNNVSLGIRFDFN